MTQTLLTLLSAAIWWVIYSSAAAVVPAVIGWFALRWLERVPVVFNRVYLASLLWMLLAVLTGGLVIAAQHGQAVGQSVFALPWMRAALVLDMLAGVWLIWRLVPRVDARRVKPTSACMVVALVMVVAMIGGTALHR
ncbi:MULTISPECIES: hypothetical protein [unclassified Luteibacter]|uniref:hypothetical protein n=1 Tax=unclassified Luteibacter TaxID=2620188 RepID=UPI0008D87C72|nr:MULTISPECIES: hypothetical protein [unclassified Luteibacter]MDR6938171.1 hypothetical protein [Luteibacter sp. 3190]SEP08609.1 hypothetical protein SAMN02800692_3564 [Luteibacter sp. UNC138MFCol5.1]SEW06767.1 hypothetical protein SAMN04515660_2257 [Luteibacter sp. 329MFSha]